MKKLLIIHTQDSVYDYYLGIDSGTYEEIFHEEFMKCDSQQDAIDLANKYGYNDFMYYEL